MREMQNIMGMPVTLEITDASASQASMGTAFEYFRYIDTTFSTYKKNGEISRINRGELQPARYSEDMRSIFKLAEETKRITNGIATMTSGFATYTV